MIRIEDPKSGREGYTFDINWRGAAPVSSGFRDDRRDGDRDRRDGDRRDGGGRWEAERAIAACQDAVRDRAARNYGVRDLDFRRTAFDDNPGRTDARGLKLGNSSGARRHYYSTCILYFGLYSRARWCSRRPEEIMSAAPGFLRGNA